MDIVQHLAPDLWKNFVNDHPEGNIFHTPEMYKVFSQAQGYSPSLWAAVDEKQVLALMTPVEVTFYPWLRQLTSRAIIYGGVLCDPTSKGQQALSQLLEKYSQTTRKRNVFTEIRNISNTLAFQQTLLNKNFTYEDHLNYLINLSRTPDEILQSFHKRMRKQISRGLRRGHLIVKNAENRGQLRKSYDLLERTYQRANVPLAHKSLFDATFDVLLSKEMVKFLVAYVDGTPVATSVELLYKDVIYGWYSGMDREYSSYVPNELLMWHILKWGAENSYRTYDFGGAGKPDEDYGVREFKAKFAGTLVNFGRNTCIHAPLTLKVSKMGYSMVRKFL